ncbi:PREDICTED: vacuolar iron transporter homolog 2.1-like [Populus euphratica]|uniref:Vacuolar iron transporter n=1 Tax=Populus euphratica TaxID=75702 RepID=A0AAJ6X3W4_POPEU|nr:PREDICTED: vacuolar iron transporter homolog 2.1-like [Populus euphratica]
MALHQISGTCAEHTISVADEDARKVQRLRRAQWLRAAILGANDGLLSTASLMLGIGAAKEDRRSMVLSGLAGAVAGACSMAVGEFVSVSTQKDIQKETVSHVSSKNYGKDAPGIGLNGTATTASIKGEAKLDDSKVISEPTQRMPRRMILESKLPPGMSPGRDPAMKVIQEDGKRSPEILREDDGEEVLTNPNKAAVASGVSFSIGSCVPLLPAVLVAQNVVRIVVIAVVASIALAFVGGFGAYLGGSPIRISAVRILLGGWIAMAITFGLLKPFDKDHS